MKQLTLLLLSFLVLNVYGQISTNELPISQSYQLSTAIESKALPALNMDLIEAEDNIMAEKGGLYQIGRIHDVNFSLNNSGNWKTLPNGDRIWRLKLVSKDAKGLTVYYNDLNLPDGAKLFVYNEAKTQVFGAYTNVNNIIDGVFSTRMINDNNAIVEYFEPAEVANLGNFTISGVGRAYRGVRSLTNNDDAQTEGFGDSDACQVNINCSEGSNWQDTKRSVARILVRAGNTQGWCTGSLVNNTNEDSKQYFLTAYHCSEDQFGNQASTANFNQWIFYFNYEASGCNNPSSEPGSNTITGGVVRSSSGDAGDNSSDFLLMEFNNNVPASYNACYAGWRNNNASSGSGVGIHHPSGDIKKISTYSSALSTSGWNGSGLASHWRVQWVGSANGHGVTEGGSSGSPIFDNSGLIVGTLTGGSSFCNATSSPDFYGKMSYHWTSNGTASNRRLLNWLDPNNTGASSLASSCGGGTGSCSADDNLPVTNNFQSTTFPNNGFAVSNPDSDGFGWQRTTATGGNGASSASAYMNNYDGDGNNNPRGTYDWIILPKTDFTGTTVASLRFDLAYTTFASSGTIGGDSLLIAYALDCGTNYSVIWSSGGDQLSTAPPTDDAFVPTSSQWQSIGVDLSFLAGEDVVQIALINLSDWSNNMFIDNINLSTTPVAVEPIETLSNFTIAPNPTNGAVNLSLDFDKQENFEVLIYNNLGQVVHQQTENTQSTVLNIDLSNQPVGVYHITIKTADGIKTKKLILTK